MLMATTTACLNNNVTSSSSSKSGLLSSDATSGSNGGNSSASGFVTISRVIRTASNPAANLDLLGDGSGSLGKFCIANQAGGAAPGSTTCTCRYDFNLSNGDTQQYEVQTVYSEGDLIRCPYSIIPPGVEVVRVKVHFTNSDTFSNEILFRLTGSTTTLNLLDSASFARVQRYQCKDLPLVPYAFDTAIYDPIASENPKILMPLNFYSTNLGGSLAAYVTHTLPARGTGFFCPSIPNDQSAGMDLRVFSLAPDPATGSSQIFPPQGGFDRSEFYLPRKPAGAFRIPVNAFGAPNITTADPAANGNNVQIPSLGYGAAPIPTGPEQERCPNSSEVQIPTGFRLVKVWQFRTSIEDRKARTGLNLAGSVGTIACNPGHWNNFTGFGTSDAARIFEDCPEPDPASLSGTPAGYAGGAGFRNPSAVSEIGPATAKRLADRIFGDGMCVRLDPTTNTLNAAGAGYSVTNAAGAFRTNYTNAVAAGSDRWVPVGNATSLSCTALGVSDPLMLCSLDPINREVPRSGNVAINSVDEGVSRFDFLFTVSPDTLQSGDVRRQTPIAHPYIPYRFKTPSDCLSADPAHPDSASDCRQETRLQYGFREHDVAVNGDAPANEPERTPVFPVCALQPL